MLRDFFFLSFKKMADHPVVALLCSIFIGPLGIQGWVVSRKNTVYGTTVSTQQGLCVALYVLIGVLLATTVVRIFTSTEQEKQRETWGLRPKSVGSAVQDVVSIGILVCWILSFLLAVRIVILYYSSKAASVMRSMSQ
jgi:hypothetical protein